jgi:hypothetical protein
MMFHILNVVWFSHRASQKRNLAICFAPTSHISNSPHSPFLYVIRRLLFVGRNSNPSSFQGLSNLAVPGIPNGFTSDATASEVGCLFEDNGVINAEDVARDERKSAVVNLMFLF